ncbi:MAG: AIPR family protein [Rhizobiaceae bacterium]|nr:AIPR family protein [Rhizobiaceae bacterium]
MNNDYYTAHLELLETVSRNSNADRSFQAQTFFDEFSSLATEAGDTPNLEWVEISHEEPPSYQVNGYAYDSETREMVLAITDFDNGDALRSINGSEAKRLFDRCFRFFSKSQKQDFVQSLEESSDAFVIASTIYENRNHIRRVRVILFTNAASVLQKSIESDLMEGITVAKNLFDLGRYSKILTSKTNSEPIEIDLSEFDHGALPCLQISTATSDYESYLCVIPGALLADIYQLYGGKLLEQNVRVFLQARTKVNKGIIETLSKKPERFFAYNNGLTVTASSIETSQSDGKLTITKINNLQIVNGGQTTASLLYARDVHVPKVDLTDVSIQMKLSVIPEKLLDEVVPKISRYSNTQNRISEVDFASSQAFHLYMEKTAQRKITPVQDGAATGSKWFYERARGQYRNRQAYMSSRDRTRFLVEYPKNQLLQKIDIAKYQLSVDQKPFAVVKGPFPIFSKIINEAWAKNEAHFNDLYFEKLISNAILFRGLDQHIMQSQWYKENRGHKAEVVTYTIAYFINWLEKQGFTFDTEKVWKEQSLSSELIACLDEIAQQVREFITNPPSHVINVREYCKKEECWKSLKLKTMVISSDPSIFGKDKSEAKIDAEQAREEGVLDRKLDFEMRLYSLTGVAYKIISEGKRLKLLTPNSNRGLEKLGRGAFNIPGPEMAAIKELLQKLASFDVEF